MISSKYSESREGALPNSTLAAEGAMYDAYYYESACGRTYCRDETWLNFFDGIAERIVTAIQPTTVLDAGCAMGMLVECLRKRGVEAFGVDISPYAIENVHPDIHPYCWIGSVSDPFPRTYDLIVSIEVLEHLPKAEAEKAITNFCEHSEDVLFSSTPVDYKEATHVNVQPPEYWGELFARRGFFRDVDFDATFITAWAARFRKSTEPVPRLVRAYERRLWYLQQDNQARREVIFEQRDALAKQEEAVRHLRCQMAGVRTQVQELQDLKASPGWAVLKALQRFRAWVAPPGSHRDKFLVALFKVVQLSGKDVWRTIGGSRNSRP
jgi:hypothetical protein